MGRIFSILITIFLILVATLGLAAYVIQNQYGAGTTFVDFFQMKFGS